MTQAELKMIRHLLPIEFCIRINNKWPDRYSLKPNVRNQGEWSYNHMLEYKTCQEKPHIKNGIFNDSRMKNKFTEFIQSSEIQLPSYDSFILKSSLHHVEKHIDTNNHLTRRSGTNHELLENSLNLWLQNEKKVFNNKTAKYTTIQRYYERFYQET